MPRSKRRLSRTFRAVPADTRKGLLEDLQGLEASVEYSELLAVVGTFDRIRAFNLRQPEKAITLRDVPERLKALFERWGPTADRRHVSTVRGVLRDKVSKSMRRIAALFKSPLTLRSRRAARCITLHPARPRARPPLR